MAKDKLPKDKWLGARVDANMDAEVSTYIEAADMVMGDLIRKSVREYMQNHPIKQMVPEQTTITKPGE